MKKQIAIGCIVVLSMLGGCASMEQAPLVYSSTNQIGIIVSGGKAENPTPSVMIGYSGVDVAIVPVAVAKRCDKNALAAADQNSAASNCRKIDPSIVPIWGANQKTAASSVDEGRINAFNSEIRIIDDEILGIERLIKAKTIEISNINLEINRLKEEKTKIAATSPAISTSDTAKSESNAAFQENNVDGNNEQLTNINSRIATLEKKKVEELESEQESNKSKLTEKQNKVASLRREIDNISNRTNNSDGDDKRDALSVYGTFDGSAKTEAEKSTGLTVGKTFSTGIAAQNITQGIKDGADSLATAKCYDVARLLLSSLEQNLRTPEIVQLTINNCGLPKRN